MEDRSFNLLNKALMLGGVLVVGLLVFLVGQMVYQGNMLDQQNQNQITVSGQGKVYAKPDIATISLGVNNDGKTVAEAVKAGTEKMNAVIEKIKALGVKDEDIKTTNYTLTPVYENYEISPQPPTIMNYSAGSVSIPERVIIKKGSTITGYKLEQNVQVKIRDFTKIGEIISQSTATGANLVGDLQFTIDDPEQFRQKARIEAIKEAKEKAKNISKEAGVKLGKLINFYENYYSPYAYDSYAKMGMGSASEVAPTPVIQPGQQEISVTINLTYKVK